VVRSNAGTVKVRKSAAALRLDWCAWTAARISVTPSVMCSFRRRDLANRHLLDCAHVTNTSPEDTYLDAEHVWSAPRLMVSI